MERRGTVAAEWSAAAGLRRVMTTGDVARLLRADRKHVWQWLSGRWMPSADSVVKLSLALDRPAGAIIEACLAARAKRLERLAAAAALRDEDER